MFELLRENPVYAELILKQKALAQKVAQWKEEEPERKDQEEFLSKRALGLLGKTATRNLVTAIRLARMTGAGLPKKAEEPLNLSVQKDIAFALKTEALCVEQNWAYHEQAFISGFHYDCLASLFAAQKLSEEAKAAVRESYQQGLWLAQHAYKLVQGMKGVRFDKYAFGGALVLPIGNALGAALYPKGGADGSWAAVGAESEKYGKCKSAARLFFQKKTFGFTYNALSALYAESMTSLSEIAPALRYVHEPWLIKPQQKDLYQLAMIWSIAQTFAEAKELKLDTKLPWSKAQALWLRKNNLNETTLIKAMMPLRTSEKKS